MSVECKRYMIKLVANVTQDEAAQSMSTVPRISLDQAPRMILKWSGNNVPAAFTEAEYIENAAMLDIVNNAEYALWNPERPCEL